MRKIKLFYNDGTSVECGGDDDEEVTLTFSKKFIEAPSDGIACVHCDDAMTGRSPVYANEFYYQMPINGHGKGCTGGSMKIGAFLRQLGIVKFGGWTDSINHNNQMVAASKDTYVDRLSAKRREPSEAQED